jgi:hypothetical protein
MHDNPDFGFGEDEIGGPAVGGSGAGDDAGDLDGDPNWPRQLGREPMSDNDWDDDIDEDEHVADSDDNAERSNDTDRDDNGVVPGDADTRTLAARNERKPRQLKKRKKPDANDAGARGAQQGPADSSAKKFKQEPSQ